MDVLTQLSHEHEILRTHLERVESAAERRDADTLAAELEAARSALTEDLDPHIAVEEAEAFTAIAETLGDNFVAQFYKEHGEIRALRDDLYASLARGETPFESALCLRDVILAHQEREDMMLFPSAREAQAGNSPLQ
jgi:hemerythrin-like domain-containing protein